MKRSFGKTLEDKANELAAERDITQWETSIPAILRREIALTVDQIERLKFLRKDQFQQLLRLECYVGTELMRLRGRIPWYTQDSLSEEAKFKKQMLDIDKERRHLTLRLDDKKQTLEDRLLSLINKHEQLDLGT